LRRRLERGLGELVRLPGDCYGGVVSIHRPLLASLFCLLLGCASTARPAARAPAAEPASIKLRLASSLWPPFVDTGDDPGVAVDLVTKALARAGYIAQDEVTSLEVVLRGLREGTYDGSSSLWRSPEREEFLLYSNAYLENRLMLVGPKGSKVDAASFAELKGKKIGLVKDYAYGPEVEQAKEPVFMRGASTEEENLRALLRGEVDYVLCDALVIHQLTLQYPRQVQEKLAMGSRPLITRALHFTVRKDRPDAQRIIDGFNQQLAKMLSDGTYHQALHVDWIHADVDGDGKLELVAAGDEVGTKAPSAGYQLVGFAPGGATADPDPAHARFMIKGVAYDSWDAVPDDLKKTPSDAFNPKPGTLRVSVFEF
jgi:polar amino acid transport system substrate-binding protein